jgi:glutamate carboxypeptidase
MAYDALKAPSIPMNTYAPWLDWIDSQEQTLLLRVKQWVAINSFTLHVKGLEQLLLLLHSSFKNLGGESSYFNLQPQKILGSDGVFHSQPLGQALLLRKRPQAPIQVLLAGHMDTVHIPSSPFQNIHELAPGIWKGPGVADMKGGIAILLTALEALERSPFADQVGWEILLTPDEELGSPGSAFLYETAAHRHHCGLIFEPSFPDGAFVSQRKGSATFTIAVKGKAAHVGRDYSQGRNAVFALARFIHKLEALQAQKDFIVNVADIEGKGPVNIVPPFASCRVNLRSSQAEALQQAATQLQHFAKESEQEGIRFEIAQDSFRLPKPFDTATQHLFEGYARCANDLNLPFQTRQTGGVCDGNILAAAGLPTLDTAGVIGGALHTPDEYLICSSLVERAKLTALFLFKLANREIVMAKEKIHG